jgi:hypothetical protein
MRLQGLGKLKKSTSSGTLTGDLAAYSIMFSIRMSVNILRPYLILYKYAKAFGVFGIFFFICIVGDGSILGPLGTSATSGLWYLPGVIVRMNNLVE